MPFRKGQIHVPDDGSLDAPIVLVGEAPGKREVAVRRPFVGPSGARLAEWWKRYGLRRKDFYITNVVPYLPHNIAAIPPPEMAEHRARLLDRLAKLKNPKVIVVAGNYALYALTGKGRVAGHMRDGRLQRPGITQHRGSVYFISINNREVPVIGTIHPAATFARGGKNRKRAAQYTRACLIDWQRVAELASRKYPVTQLNYYPHRHLVTRPSFEDVRELLRPGRWHYDSFMALDIETPWRTERRILVRDADGNETWVGRRDNGQAPVLYKSGKHKGQPKTKLVRGAAEIACISFSDSPDWAISIPLTLDYWIDQNVLDAVKSIVATVLALPVQKVMQNGLFDTYWLESEGYVVAQWCWDTRAMHHALDPTAPHDLAYLASVYTREPYWKDECKDPESLSKFVTNSDALWAYNAKDSAVTAEIFLELRAALDATKSLGFYYAHYAALFRPLLDMSLAGMKIDAAAHKRLNIELKQQLSVCATKTNELAGCEIVKKKGVSSAACKKYFYETLGLPVQYVRDPKTRLQKPTTNEVAIKKLIDRYPAIAGPVGTQILLHRKLSKELELVDTGKLSPDGRLRCLFSPFTDAGRLSAQKTPKDEGRNLQNIKRGKMRRIFLPD